MDKKTNEFCKTLQPWGRGLKRAIIVAVAGRQNQDTRLLYGRVWLDDGRGIDPQPDYTVITSRLVALRRTIDIDQFWLSDILKDIENKRCKLKLGDWEIGLKPPDALQSVSAEFYSQSPLVPGPRRVLQLDLISSDTIGENYLHPEIEAELLIHDPPFIGKQDLLSELQLSEENFAPSRARVLSFFARAPWEANEDSRLSDNGLNAPILVPADLDLSKLSFGVVALPRSGVPVRTQVKDGISIESEKNGYRTVSFFLPFSEAVRATVTIAYDGKWYGAFGLEHATLRFQPLAFANRFFFEKDDFGTLLPKASGKSMGDAPMKLEAVIAMLLALSGTIAISYQKTITDGPDIIAVTAAPHSDFLVIEVTTGNPKPGKLDNLQRRAKALAHALPRQQGSMPNVFPVLVTSLPFAATGDYADDATKLGIAVFYREDIELAAKSIPKMGSVPGLTVRQALNTRISDKNRLG
jgi:hypothetical protein